MTVRSARLGSGSTGTANVTVTLYTCPSGRTAIVKSVYVSNASGSAVSTILAIQSGGTFINLSVSSLAVSGVFRLDPMWVVLEPGDSIVLNANVLNALKYTVSGAELDGVAP